MGAELEFDLHLAGLFKSVDLSSIKCIMRLYLDWNKERGIDFRCVAFFQNLRACEELLKCISVEIKRRELIGLSKLESSFGPQFYRNADLRALNGSAD